MNRAPGVAGFTSDHELLRESVRKFGQTVVAPNAERWDEEGDFPSSVFREAAKLGMFGLRVDPKWGGAGLDWWAVAACIEALADTDSTSVSLALLTQMEIALPVIDTLGTDEQKREFLAPAIGGERIGALGVSEPGGGSDVAAIQTRARRVGDDFIVRGQKLWITNGARAGFIVLAVRTAEAGHRGISLLLVPTDTRGFSVGRRLSKIGHRASDTAELFFDECKVPARFLLGQENQGFYYIMRNFQGERLGAAMLCTALMARALEEALDYGRGRKAFGKPVADFQVWRHRLAEHATTVEAAKCLNYAALAKLNRGENATREISMAKLFSTDVAQKVIYDCMQIFGGFGYTTEYSIGRLWRDIRMYTVGGGTSEIMKEIIAKDWMDHRD
jgi:citronellyl-CoA dehydrogenase